MRTYMHRLMERVNREERPPFVVETVTNHYRIDPDRGIFRDCVIRDRSGRRVIGVREERLVQWGLVLPA